MKAVLGLVGAALGAGFTWGLVQPWVGRNVTVCSETAYNRYISLRSRRTHFLLKGITYAQLVAFQEGHSDPGWPSPGTFGPCMGH